MSTFATCTYNELADLIGQEAIRLAEQQGVDYGGLLICPRAHTTPALEWIREGKPQESSIRLYHFDPNREMDLLENIPNEVLDEIATNTARLPVIKLHNEDHLYISDYGTSICYPVHEHETNKTSLDIVLLVCCRNTMSEREICIALRPIIKSWAELQKKWIPRLHLRCRKVAV